MADAGKTTANGDNQMKADFDRLRADFDRLVKDLASTAKHGREVAVRSGSEAVSAAREQMDVVADDLSRRVRENPLTACAIAAGVGVVLGLLVGSRR